jgi:hypothetical protein
MMIENNSGTISALTEYGGTVEISATCTISQITVYSTATFDARNNAGVITATNASVYGGGKFLDPIGTVSLSNPLRYFGEVSADLLLGMNEVSSAYISRS